MNNENTLSYLHICGNDVFFKVLVFLVVQVRHVEFSLFGQSVPSPLVEVLEVDRDDQFPELPLSIFVILVSIPLSAIRFLHG